jgi:L-alanine-DL-glutamate epimerase-like enolase superfamily enzyme
LNRRGFLTGSALCAGSAFTDLLPGTALAALSDLKITRVRVFNPANATNLDGPLNLSEILVAIDTDAGITGYGQGGTPDLLRYAASLLIGQDPFRTEQLWQRMYRSSIYPAGREKLNAVGALDCALWDIKGKVLDVPVYQLLGGRARDHIDCYKSFGMLRLDQARDEARRTMAEGYRAIRSFGVAGHGSVFDARRYLREVITLCTALREGVGQDGDFIFDAHTRLDFAEAARLCDQLAPLDPLFVEDPLHTMDDLTLFAALRHRVKVPLAAGEQFGELRDGNLPLVEQGLIDYLRSSIPNVGGITAYRKIAALCEAHSVSLVPHFTSPIGTAAIGHCLLNFPGQVLNEAYRTVLPDYLKEGAVFRDGRMGVGERPGLGVVVDERRLTLIAAFTQARPPELYQGESIHRPDGSHLYL